MFKSLLFIIFSYVLFAPGLKGQSFTSAKASATIVTPVGTESIEEEDVNSIPILAATLSTLYNYSVHNQLSSINSGLSSQSIGITSVKLLHNNYTFGLIQTASPIFKDAYSDSILIKLTSLDSRSIKLNDYTSIISINTAIIIKPKSPGGLYTTKHPLQVIIAFD